jgi:hypothetical protein
MPAAKTNEFIKALRVRMKGPVPAVVPLAKTPRCISGLAQKLGDRHFLALHEFISSRHSCHSGSGRVAAGQQCGPRWGARHLHEKSLEPRSLIRDTVHVRSFDPRVPVDRQISIALVVRHHQYDVRTRTKRSSHQEQTAEKVFIYSK